MFCGMMGFVSRTFFVDVLYVGPRQRERAAMVYAGR